MHKTNFGIGRAFSIQYLLFIVIFVCSFSVLLRILVDCIDANACHPPAGIMANTIFVSSFDLYSLKPVVGGNIIINTVFIILLKRENDNKVIAKSVRN